MTRDDYEEYLRRFNAKDYAGVWAFYAPGAALTFFGQTIRSGEELARFYGFLHAHVIETVTIERFAASEELLALEGVVRVEAFKDLTRAALDAQGLQAFFPIARGEVQEMRQMIHYAVQDGKFTGVTCALM